MSTILSTILSIMSGSGKGGEPAAVDPAKALELERAYQEFRDANTTLHQAQSNFDSADAAFIGIAVEDLNIAYHRVDQATRKLRLLTGGFPLEPHETATLGRAWLAQ